MKILCGKNLGMPCPREAVEFLLLEAEPGSGDWHARPRCGEHPAADDIRLLGKLPPVPKWIVLPIPERALPAVLSDAEPGEERASCGCPIDEGLVRHRRGLCRDPVVAKLGWYFDAPTESGPGRQGDSNA